MIIKERPIITWLLNPNDTQIANHVVVANASISINYDLLLSYLEQLKIIRAKKPNWGLPELVMQSFVDVMYKSHNSFDGIMPTLFKEFSATEECGILLQGNYTFVYGFGDDGLHLWCFTEYEGKSVLNFYSLNNSIDGKMGVGIHNTILADNNLFEGSLEQREKRVSSFANFIASYVTVKNTLKLKLWLSLKENLPM